MSRERPVVLEVSGIDEALIFMRVRFGWPQNHPTAENIYNLLQRIAEEGRVEVQIKKGRHEG